MDNAMSAAASISKDNLVDLLGGYISEKCLKPGDRLPSIRELAERFGVKSGIVRDALLDAQGKGVVKVLPRAGAFVQANGLPADSTPPQRLQSQLQELLTAQDQNLFHLIACRETLEVELISLAARRSELQDLFSLRRILEKMSSMALDQRCQRYTQLDVDFHLEIARLSGNEVMAAMLHVIMEELVPILQELSWSAKRSTQTDESHAKMYAAIVKGDVAVARNEIQSHLQVAYLALLDQLREPPEMCS